MCSCTKFLLHSCSCFLCCIILNWTMNFPDILWLRPWLAINSDINNQHRSQPSPSRKTHKKCSDRGIILYGHLTRPMFMSPVTIPIHPSITSITVEIKSIARCSSGTRAVKYFNFQHVKIFVRDINSLSRSCFYFTFCGNSWLHVGLIHGFHKGWMSWTCFIFVFFENNSQPVETKIVLNKIIKLCLVVFIKL